MVEVWCAAAMSMRAHAPGLDSLGPSTAVGTTLTALLDRIVESVRSATSLTAVADGVDRTLAAADSTLPTVTLVAEFLGGVGDSCRNCDDLDATRVAMAFEAGVDRMRSTAGRTLDAAFITIATAVAEAALRAADGGLPLAEMLIEAADSGLDALEARATAELAADVSIDGSPPATGVDPLAAGLLVVLDAFVAVVHGDDPELPSWEFEPDDDESVTTESFRYAVSLRVDAAAQAGSLLSVAWRSLGGDVDVAHDPVDSLLVGSVTTDDIGAVIEAAIAIGRPSRIVVRDLHS